ncbi:MAG TPA: trigger factor [Steroidobacteraceae bacterium]|nr:trigger factor [Steroidobacteraceae bacterium]
MKTDVEELSPTRVRLTVEVPFDELKPSLDHAYREVGRQVRIPGFRPGHVPRQVLDQRVGRGAVLEHAINEAVPELYARAVREAQVLALGQPDVEITKLDDGTEMAFTAEVDVRPSFEIPDLSALQVVVDDADVSPDQVEEYLGALRERFASLRAAARPAQPGDYVSIDLAAQVDGQPVEDAQATGISYEVGSGTMLDGLDEALAGMSADETATFTTELAGGQLEGSQADVTVTVRSVKVKDLPELDDEFAQSASEFNTVGELRANTRKQMEAMREAGQAGQARDRAIEALLTRIEMPLPESLVEHEIEHRRESLERELEQAGLTMDTYAEGRQISVADIEKEVADEVRRSVKARFILDQLAEQENLGIEQDEIGQYITQLAYQQGVSPDQFARQLTSSGQLAAVVSDVLRSKAADLLAERVKVTDESGRKVAVGSPEETGAAEGDGSGDDEVAAEPADAAASPAPAKGRSSRRGGAKAAEGKDGKEARSAAGQDEDAAAKPKGRARRSRKDQDPQAGAAGEE